MNLNQPTLIQFENERSKNNLIPPNGSNSFYEIGSGRINISSKRDANNAPRFDLFTDQGDVYTGIGNFIISKESDSIYDSISVLDNTSLSNNQMITIVNGSMEVYGSFVLMKHSHLILKRNSIVTFHLDSEFDVDDYTNISIENGSKLVIYGKINVFLGSIDIILNNSNIIIDSAAVMNVTGMDKLGERDFSLYQYDNILRGKNINIHTRGESNFTTGRVGYIWKHGDPLINSQIITLELLYGKCVLGDFKVSILGMPKTLIPNLQIVNNLHIHNNTTLYITDQYNEHLYIRPELYLGIIIDNNEIPADCIIDGTIIVNGKNSFITLDRGATIHINKKGYLYLQNGATLRSTYNENLNVLYIEGTLVIDDISQISTLNADNIVFGENGKVIILNPDTGERKLLWKTPIDIESSDLYRLFKNTITHVEYHISNNTGIGIDKFYDFYSRDFTSWYGGMRIEKAIHEGLIIWHNGGFIELDNEIIPWVNMSCTLLEASRLFKTFGSYDKDKLQDAVDRLKYAGCGNILFRFIQGRKQKEVLMVLDDVKMLNVLSHPISDMYTLKTDNDGTLFMRNNVQNVTRESIINKKSRIFDIVNKKSDFLLK